MKKKKKLIKKEEIWNKSKYFIKDKYNNSGDYDDKYIKFKTNYF